MATNPVVVANNAITPVGHPIASLYVGDLGPEVAEADLFEKFSTVGPVLSIRVCRDAVSRRSLGYAYVNFQQPSDAERAIETMNFEVIGQKPIRIMWSQRDPANRRSGASNIFIKNLDKETIDNKALHDTFSLFGTILSCKVAVDERGHSKGYGFIHFEREDAAQKAITSVNGMLLAGKKVFVGKFVPRAVRQKERGDSPNLYSNVFVKNFGEELTKAQLDKLFGAYGKITSSVVVTDADGKSKGFGFVAYEDPKDAEKAVAALNDFQLDGSDKRLFVGPAQKKSERLAELRKKFELQRAERLKNYQGTNVYVKNLDEAVDDEKLHEMFAPFGTITSVKVMRDEQSISKGFGFVSYEKAEQAQKAIAEMNSKMESGKPLYVALAQRKDDRRAQLAAQYMQRLAQMRTHPGAAGTIYTAGQGGYFVASNYQANNGRPFMQTTHMAAVRNAQPRWSAPQQQGYGQAPHYMMQQGAGYPPIGGQSRAMRPGGGLPPQQRHMFGNNPRAGPGTQRSVQAPIDTHALAHAPQLDQKQILGERIYAAIEQKFGAKADPGKVTGMLLEMENADLLLMLEHDDVFDAKVREALAVLAQHP